MIKILNTDLWENFEKILKENWEKIYENSKFHTSYFDQDKEVTLRFRIKERNWNEITLEAEKVIKHLAWELPVEIKTIKVQI